MVFIPVHISILLVYQFLFRNIVIPETTTVPCMTTSSFLSHKMTYFEDIIDHNQEVVHFVYWFSNQNVIRHHKLDKLCLQTTPKRHHCPYFVSTVSSWASALPDEPNYFPCVGPCNYLCIHFLSFIKKKSLRKINELDLIMVSYPRGNLMLIYLCKTSSIHSPDGSLMPSCWITYFSSQCENNITTSWRK